MKKADYVLAVKTNQAKLLEEIEDEFRFSKDIRNTETVDLDHGRIETRKCSVINNFQYIENLGKWTNLKSVVRIESIREFKNSDKQTEQFTRYYISSSNEDADFFNK